MSKPPTDEADPAQLDPLQYLASLNGDLSPAARLKHYQALRPALLRVQRDQPVAFDVAMGVISRRLGIKGKTVLQDLARLTPPATARELLDSMGQTRPLHLPQDFVEEKLWFGVRAGDDILLLNSARELLTLDQLPQGLTVKDHGFDRCRLSKAAIVRFLHGETSSDPDLLLDLQGFFSRFVVFRDPRVPLLLATWTLGTYVYRIFRVFPYLALRSPEKRCGKSRVLDLLSLVAFNASARVVHPTEAQLFRGPSRNGGTLLLDEIEALGRTDREMFSGLLAVLNSGFEQGGSVSRLEKTPQGAFQEVSFETYCPRALAGINRLAETLEDRAIMIIMQRKLPRERTERFSPTRLRDLGQTLRDRCYLWALTRAQDLAEVYDAADRWGMGLEALDDRARDVWEPLVALTALCDGERGDREGSAFTRALTGLARDLSQVRESVAEDSTVVQVLQALATLVDEEGTARGLLAGQPVVVPPAQLAPKLAGKLSWEKLSPKGLAGLLAPLGLAATKLRQEGKVIRAYQLHREELAELRERYGGG